MREDLYEAVTRGARELLRADACQIHRLDVDADELILVSSDPTNAPAHEPAAGRRPAGARPDAAPGAKRPQRRTRADPRRWPDAGDHAVLAVPAGGA